MPIKTETDLYEPIKAYLEGEGYRVQAEVKGCDVVATRGEDVLIVELKRQFNLKLLFQAIQRQQVCSSVFLAFPLTKAMASRKRINEIKALAKRLHLGLMIVHDRPSGYAVEVPLVPDFQVFRVNVKAQKAFLKELYSREHSVNTGGMVKRKIVTAHKERGLAIAAFLRVHGPQNIEAVATYMGQSKAMAGQALRANHYGWYLRIEKGIYAFDPSGESDFRNYGDLVTFYELRAQGYSQSQER